VAAVGRLRAKHHLAVARDPQSALLARVVSESDAVRLHVVIRQHDDLDGYREAAVVERAAELGFVRVAKHSWAAAAMSRGWTVADHKGPPSFLHVQPRA